MTQKQPEPALTLHRKTTLRVPHELAGKILREALKIPADARFSAGDPGGLVDCEFTWSSEEPLAAISLAHVLTPKELDAARRELAMPGGKVKIA